MEVWTGPRGVRAWGHHKVQRNSPQPEWREVGDEGWWPLVVKARERSSHWAGGATEDICTMEGVRWGRHQNSWDPGGHWAYPVAISQMKRLRPRRKSQAQNLIVLGLAPRAKSGVLGTNQEMDRVGPKGHWQVIA